MTKDGKRWVAWCQVADKLKERLEGVNSPPQGVDLQPQGVWRVFLTGATGFVGATLLADLLDQRCVSYFL